MSDLDAEAKKFQEKFAALREQIANVIVGQEQVIDQALVCFFAGGHALLEGVPGLGKTVLVKALADACSLDFSRIQFTPDLMPADILGTDIVFEDESGRRTFEFRPGPIHSQIVLADEINRATPKTQSAMLEAMQEGTVTSGRTTYTMKQPFFVMATQNPIEQEGTYPLPEAQLDRFLLKILVNMPTRDELKKILWRTTGSVSSTPEALIDSESACELRSFVREIVAADNVQDLAARLVLATHPESEFSTPEVRRFVRNGASPRGAQALILAAKVKAAAAGRLQVDFGDIRDLAVSALNHRVGLNFEGEAEGKTGADVVKSVLLETPDVA
jgi:MoxR-like ATPase